MNFRTGQLILIRKGRTLLKLWETQILKYKKYEVQMDFIRPMIEYISENYTQSEDLTGVEIGVACGDNAFSILNTLPIKKLYLIDPYLEYEEFKGNYGWEERYQREFDGYFRNATDLLQDYNDKIQFIIKKSEDAIYDVPGDLDFVYVDGNHDYEYVKSDLELYYPKLKLGGILGGDNFESLTPSVSRAVLEFTDKHGLKIYGGRSPASYEWWVIKK